ncbi:MAG TPA: hypothetical protein VGF40_17810 [Thermoanaerobaculia bacterium]
MARLVATLGLLAALSAHATGVPLSDVPLAPLPVTAVAVGVADDAVLGLYAVGADLYVQRLHLAGTPIDPIARYLARDPGGFRAVMWAAGQWTILAGSEAWWLDRDGAVAAHRSLGTTPVAAAVVGDRVAIVDRAWARPGLLAFRALELAPDGQLTPTRQAVAPGNSSAVPVAVDGGTGLAVTQTLTFSTSPREILLGVYPPGAGEPAIITVVAPTLPIVRDFVPNPRGGGLFLWNDGGLMGLLVGPDASLSSPFAIGPRGAIASPRAAPREGGWDVLWLMGETVYAAAIAVDGSTDVRTLRETIALAPQTAFVSVPGGALLLEPRRAPASGVDVHTIAAGYAGNPRIVAYANAFQGEALAATGGGLDLVVWTEQAADGLVLKATRIAPTGLPLDGAGLEVAVDRVAPWASFSASFDGEAFVVAWIRMEAESGRSLLMRRVTLDGALEPVRFLGDAPWPFAVEVEGAGGGRAAVAWWGGRSWYEYRNVFVPIDRGEPGAQVEIASSPLGRSLPRLAFGEDRYLAVFHDQDRCRINECQAPVSYPIARMLALDGTPLGEPRRLSTDYGWDPDVVWDGRGFVVVFQDRALRISPEFEIGPEKELARRGALSVEGAEVRIDAGLTRAVYFGDDLVRLEPLPLGEGDVLVDALSRGACLVRPAREPRRLYIRRAPDTVPADLAIVATGALERVSEYGSRAGFRIEHRGGAPVRRIELWSNGGIKIDDALPQPSVVLDRELREGESIDVTLDIWLSWSNPLLWVAGDAVDVVPENNAARYERPLRPRGRTAKR